MFDQFSGLFHRVSLAFPSAVVALFLDEALGLFFGEFDSLGPVRGGPSGDAEQGLDFFYGVSFFPEFDGFVFEFGFVVSFDGVVSIYPESGGVGVALGSDVEVVWVVVGFVSVFVEDIEFGVEVPFILSPDDAVGEDVFSEVPDLEVAVIGEVSDRSRGIGDMSLGGSVVPDCAVGTDFDVWVVQDEVLDRIVVSCFRCSHTISFRDSDFMPESLFDCLLGDFLS